MLFNSTEFLIFLPIVFILYWIVFRKSLAAQNVLILLASYLFYAWWDWRFLFLLLLSTFIDYGFGLLIYKSEKKKKLFLWLSIINNLGILAFFKYYNFFAQSTKDLFSQIGFEAHPYFLNIVLPVGISFYTFHGMSYVFDIYRGKVIPTKNYIDYSVFVSFFPLLVAGPIERATHLLPQVQRVRSFSTPQFKDGIKLIVWGFFKKVVVADSIAPIVDEIFQNHSQHSGLTLAFGAILFSIQIYGDFSGYTDIALGTAKLFGFELITNFKFPYFSRNIAEFWRRWHISLSSWFRDYLYIPLGGSKVSKWKAIRNTFIIFLVSGFWHGANWTYIFWGGLHAVLFIPLLVLKVNRKHVAEDVAAGRILPTPKELIQIVTTFLLVTFAWIFFRAESVSLAFSFISRMFSDLNSTLEYSLIFYFDIAMILLMVIYDYILLKKFRLPAFTQFVLYFFLCIAIAGALFENRFTNQFIYFQF